MVVKIHSVKCFAIEVLSFSYMDKTHRDTKCTDIDVRPSWRRVARMGKISVIHAWGFSRLSSFCKNIQFSSRMCSLCYTLSANIYLVLPTVSYSSCKQRAIMSSGLSAESTLSANAPRCNSSYTARDNTRVFNWTVNYGYFSFDIR